LIKWYIYDINLNKKELENTELAKKALIKSYTKTFTDKPFLKGKKISKFSKDVFKRYIKMIESWDRKYKDYITEEEYKKQKAEKEKREAAQKLKNKLEKYRHDCNVKDDYESCQKYGYALAKGDGITKDKKASKDYFRKSCRYSKDNGIWCKNLGKAYYYGNEPFEKNYKESFFYFEQGCKKGNAKSCLFLGWQYRDAEGIEQDTSKAFNFFKKSCNGDDASGCFELGYAYLYAKGIYKSIDRASKYFKKSCDLGNENGCDAYKKVKKSIESCKSMREDYNYLVKKVNAKSSITIYDAAVKEYHFYNEVRDVLRKCYLATYDKNLEKLTKDAIDSIDTLNAYYKEIGKVGKEIVNSDDAFEGLAKAFVGTAYSSNIVDKANKQSKITLEKIKKAIKAAP